MTSSIILKHDDPFRHLPNGGGMIVSFGWTAPAILAGRKSVTRRDWSAGHATKFKPGMLFQLWDKLPRAKGKRIGTGKAISIIASNTSFMPLSDYEAEGFAYLCEIGATMDGWNPDMEFFLEWKREARQMWELRFEILEVRRP